MEHWQEIEIAKITTAVELIVAENVALSNGQFLICESGILALTSSALIYRPPASKIKWLMELNRIKDLKREPSGYLSSGKIQFRVDNCGCAYNCDCNEEDKKQMNRVDSLIWQCQVCEEINESNSKIGSPSTFNCKLCGSLQKGRLLEVKIDEAVNNHQDTWICEVCEDFNGAQINFCSSCGFRRPKVNKSGDDWVCANCTFINTFDKDYCQVCEAPKLKTKSNENEAKPSTILYKFSFRSGGSTIFFEKLKLVLGSKVKSPNSTSSTTTAGAVVGISGLLKRQEEINLATEASLSSAFSDLDSLMRTAEEMVQLATKISDKLRSDGLSAGERTTFKDLVESLGIESMTETSAEFNENLNVRDDFYDSIAREVSQLVQVLIKKTGTRIYSLADIYCIYNRTNRTTTGSLIAPADLVKATRLMSRKNLPIRLHKFTPKGILCLVPVQDVDPLHLYSLIKQILVEKEEEEEENSNKDTNEIDRKYGNNCFVYLTAVDLAEKLKISLFLAGQQLKMAETAGKIVRDGKRKDLPAFFSNKFLNNL